MHRRLRAHAAAIAGALALTVGFAACGSDAKSSDTTTEETAAESTTPATEETAPDTTKQPTTTAERSTTTADPTGVPADWVTYTSPEADFTAAFPAEPSEQTQSVTLPDGTSVPIQLATVQIGQRAFLTGRAEYPADLVLDPTTALQGAQDQAISNVNGTLIDSQDITVQGRPGRQFSANVTNNGVKGTVVQRVILDGQVLYENLVIGAGTIDPADDDVVAFFGSFALTS